MTGLRRTAGHRRVVDLLGLGQTTESDGEGFDMDIPIVVSLLVILVAIMASIGPSLLVTRGRKSSGGTTSPTKPMSAPTGDLKLASRPARRTR